MQNTPVASPVFSSGLSDSVRSHSTPLKIFRNIVKEENNPKGKTHSLWNKNPEISFTELFKRNLRTPVVPLTNNSFKL